MSVRVVSDRDLWLQALAGRHDAFGELFERHARAVYGFCFRRTADWTLAEDLTSVVFLEAWRRRRQIQPPEGSALPWLLGVATNVVRNAHRSRRRYRAALDRVAPPRSTPDFADELAARLDDERRMRSLLEAVSSLPRREQDVLALCGWSGLSYEEAAAALGVPVGTVRSRLSRARARLGELEPATGQVEDRNTALARAALTGKEDCA